MSKRLEELLKKYEDENEFHFHHIDKENIIFPAMIEYAREVAQASLERASKKDKIKIVSIIENAIDDFGSKWSSHDEKSAGISEYADKILQLEIPDREDEMLQMLERVTSAFYGEELELYQFNRIEEAKKLIQSVKQTK